jgi:hypothetical protein
MKKVIRLTENDLTRIVKRVIKEDSDMKRYEKLLGIARSVAVDVLGWSPDAAEESDVWYLLDEVGGYMDEDDYYELSFLADDLYSGDEEGTFGF